jgi:hypothetical protein
VAAKSVAPASLRTPIPASVSRFDCSSAGVDRRFSLAASIARVGPIVVVPSPIHASLYKPTSYGILAEVLQGRRER